MANDSYKKRSLIIGGIYCSVALIFFIRLLMLQVFDDSWKLSARSNVIRKITEFPARGLIYDRNDNLLVYNQAAYDVLAAPKEIGEFDTLSMCSILGVTKEDLIARIEKARKYSSYRPSIIFKQLSADRYALLQEKLYKFSGFFVQIRTIRKYPHPNAAHLLGYVGEVSTRQLSKDKYYRMGDYVGKTGLEYSYEKDLRGVKGVKYQLVDVHNRNKGSFQNGSFDTTAVIGQNLVTSLDVDLQAYAEELMQGKAGAVVAIEPKTGEILTLVSAPTYDPELLVGRDRGKHYMELLTDSVKPLYNRAVTASYPPGSTFKTVNSLIALQEGAITAETQFHCAGPASYPIRCTHNHVTPLNVSQAIRESCNSFMYNLLKVLFEQFPTSEDGYNYWREHVLNFGFNSKISHEMTSETQGKILPSDYYNKIYGKGHWNASTVRSLSIGQGEVLCTPFQMANMVSSIANKGYYIEPHVVVGLKDYNGTVSDLYFKKYDVGIDKRHFDPVIFGMYQGVEKSWKAKVDSIAICGKTGTVQNPHGDDHSSFIAFAPKDDPKIAICVYVEQGVWGARYAAPIASLIIEKYLKGYVPKKRKWIEKEMINSNLLYKDKKKKKSSSN